jgi:hypothetical protein
MVNRVNSSNPTSAAAVAIGAWQAVMGNHPVAANRRRWAGIIFALMASAILLFQAPASPALLVRWLFSARSYGHLLAIGLGFFLALRSAASSQQAIFHIEDFKEAQKNLWRSAFGARREPFNIGNDDSKLESSESSFLHMGGPVQIQVNREHLAVFEDYQGSTRVISPRDGETSLRGFEQLRALVETKDQVAIISIWGRTKDGIRVRVDSARIVYSIRRRVLPMASVSNLGKRQILNTGSQWMILGGHFLSDKCNPLSQVLVLLKYSLRAAKRTRRKVMAAERYRSNETC